MAKSRQSRELVAKVDERVKVHVSALGMGNILVAVSGGADSMALLNSLHAVAPERISKVCMIDHGLRPENRQEAEKVDMTCRSLDVPLVVRAVDVQEAMRRTGASMETAARELRYGALRDVASEVGATYIALGHTSDDQVETVLMHAFRGSGLRGLVGMSVISDGLFRPLLTTSRGETIAYCEGLEAGYIDDPSNMDTSIRRNALRHEILPAIERHYPRFRKAIVRLAETSRRDAGYLQELAREALDSVAPEGKIIPKLWASLDESLRFGVLKLQHETENLPVLTAALVETARDLFSQANAPLHSVPDLLYMDTETVLPVNVGVPGITVTHGVRLECTLLRRTEQLDQVISLASRKQVYLDLNKLKRPLFVRSRLPGDSFQPLGMHGTKSLQDLFVDAHIPTSRRGRVPVVATESGLVWVSGFAPSDDFRVTPRTGKVMCITLSKASNAL